MIAKNRITINDVAKAAGVSKGTVDRVLHNRGEVSKDSKEKVLKIIEELGYKPNMYASLLASQKEHVIVCMIPEYSQGDFWSLTQKGIDEASQSISRYSIKVESIRYDQYDVESFRKACARVLDQRPSGVLIAPMFRNETSRFVKELSGQGIPYIYLDSKLEDDSYMAYFGMPSYQSGYLCADMLTIGRDVNKVYVIRILRDKKGLSDPSLMRRTGFVDYMKEHYPGAEIENVFIDPFDKKSREEVLDSVFLQAEGFKNIVMLNSRVHLVADYLRNRDIKDVRVVGFDALDRNIAALKNGHVHVLIAQHTDRQAVAALNAMVDYLILGINVPRKDNYTQMDILNRYNCDYYL